MKKVACVSSIILLISFTFVCGGCTKKTTGPKPGPQNTVSQNNNTQSIDADSPVPQWDEAPAMTIDTSKIYLATIQTELGDIQFEMFTGKAPVTVNNFVFLAEAGFYTNSYFHRVLPDFIAQAGKSTGGVYPGPGYSIAKESPAGLSFDEPGYVAMTRPNIFNNNASQFFISLSRSTWSDGKYTIFGKVLEGLDVVRALPARETENEPGNGVLIKSIKISESETSLLPPKSEFKPNPPVPAEGRPLAELAFDKRDFLYNQKPVMVIDPARNYTARIETTVGVIDVTLRPDAAPESVNNFYILANLGFYDNMPFSTVIASAYAVAGSPKGQLYSDIGYAVPAEPSSKLEFGRGKMGYVTYPSMDGSSSGSIFYLSQTDKKEPPNRYVTVFGEISEAGMEVLANIPADTLVHNQMAERARIIRIDVTAK